MNGLKGKKKSDWLKYQLLFSLYIFLYLTDSYNL